MKSSENGLQLTLTWLEKVYPIYELFKLVTEKENKSVLMDGLYTLPFDLKVYHQLSSHFLEMLNIYLVD